MESLNGNSIDLNAFRNFTVTDTRRLTNIRRSLSSAIKSYGFIRVNYKLVLTTYYTGSDIATLLTNKVADGTFTTVLQSSTTTKLPYLQNVFSNKTDLSIIVLSRGPSASPTIMGGSGESSDNGGLGGGAIAGITIACIFGLTAIVATWYYFYAVKLAEPKTVRFGENSNVPAPKRTMDLHEFINPVNKRNTNNTSSVSGQNKFEFTNPISRKNNRNEDIDIKYDKDVRNRTVNYGDGDTSRKGSFFVRESSAGNRDSEGRSSGGHSDEFINPVDNRRKSRETRFKNNIMHGLISIKKIMYSLISILIKLCTF